MTNENEEPVANETQSFVEKWLEKAKADPDLDEDLVSMIQQATRENTLDNEELVRALKAKGEAHED